MNCAAQLTGLTKKFGRTIALNGLDLEIPKGSIFGLIGQNGAGKTTTFSILSGILKPDTGSIDLLGKGPFNPALHKGLITVLPQDARLPGYARIIDLLVYMARLQGMPADQAITSAQQVLQWVSLTDRAKSPIRTLSHGMLRRVTIAQAFLGSPELVLLDEPTSGLDPKQVVVIRDLIRSKKGSQTIVISSHILSEIEAACDYVAFVDKGKTIRQASLDNVIHRNHIYTYRLVPAQLPVSEIAVHFPGAEISTSPMNDLLTLRLNDSAKDAGEINRIVLSVLLNAGIQILEVRLGSNLEQEYLRQV